MGRIPELSRRPLPDRQTKEDINMQVGVVYAEPEQQIWLTLEVPEGSTAEAVIEYSGILRRCPQVNLSSQKIGVFGKIIKPQAKLNEGDRVEIYRAITVDPKMVPQRKLDLDDDDDDEDDDDDD
jgi:putative ubiquitin-RnfH superfamily antitoxin RatB of RatAB toxin-antitoxin module